RILVIYSGLMVTLLLAALDQTIVATALPKIVGELGGLGSYSWVFTSYLLASTVTVPLYGKLGDVYGRRPLFFVAIGLFLAGSGHVVGALLASAVLFVWFSVVERRAREPILPFDLLRNRTVAASIVCVGLVGMAMLGTIAFVPLFVQGVIGTSATSSGVVLTP